jgi:predicted aspartyl protease
MPSAAGKRVVKGRHDGRSIITEVGIVDASKREKQKGSSEGLYKGVKPYNALIDTGATTTMLSPRIISELDLVPIGSGRFRGIHGVASRLVYLVHVVFYGDQADQQFLAQKAIRTDKIVHRAYIFPAPIEVGEIE